jgi:hypothetical protein
VLTVRRITRDHLTEADPLTEAVKRFVLLVFPIQHRLELLLVLDLLGVLRRRGRRIIGASRVGVLAAGDARGEGGGSGDGGSGKSAGGEVGRVDTVETEQGSI